MTTLIFKISEIVFCFFTIGQNLCSPGKQQPLPSSVRYANFTPHFFPSRQNLSLFSLAKQTAMGYNCILLEYSTQREEDYHG